MQRRDSIIQSMASKSSKEGTQVKVFTYAANEDAVVPDGWEIVSVEHDRSMAVTRVVAQRPYDKSQADEEREENAPAPASPSYPQTPGAVPVLNTDLTAPPTSYTWGSIDTTKVQNLPDLDKLPPPIAVQEAALKQNEEKDATEVTGEVQAAANEESAEPAHTPDKPADKLESDSAEEAKGSDNR